jgi:Transcriptional regulators
LTELLVVSQRLNRLKSVAALIDISKSTLQIDILLALSNRGEMTPAEISLAIGQRRKAVTDALRKLRNKGLVEPASDEGRSPAYRLTEIGAETVRSLISFLDVQAPGPEPGPGMGAKRPGTSLDVHADSSSRSPAVGSWAQEAERDHASGQSPPQSMPPGMLAPAISSFTLASALSQVLFALGTSKGNSLPLPELARIMGLSEQRAESYLEVFMKSEPRLFRRFTDYPWWSKALRRIGINSKPKRLVVYYGLTQDGLQHFYRLPAYSRLRRSRTYKFLSSIVFTSNPKGIVRRLILLLLVGEIFSLFGMVVPIDFRITSFWLAFTILVGSVSLSSLMLYRMIDKF